jgi:hypothetical protein
VAAAVVVVETIADCPNTDTIRQENRTMNIFPLRQSQVIGTRPSERLIEDARMNPERTLVGLPGP